MVDRNIFEDLFVLEMTNNHLGRLERGLEIVRQHACVVRRHNIRAAIKLQFRDIDSFVHRDFRDRTDIRYVRRINETRMSKGDYALLVDAIRDSGCIPMATPFDERSVDWCVEFDMPIIKVASADATDWQLLEKIASTRKPVIVSVGGAIEREIDALVDFFESRQIPLAINHCVAAYPHEAEECELNQIDYLIERFPNHVVGYSSHEHDNWVHSLTMSYAKGARTFERHIDIDSDGAQIAEYSSLPDEIDTWFKAFKAAKRYCGASGNHRIKPLPRETEFLDNYIRGAYAARDLPAGQVLTQNDFLLAIPLRKGQISCREIVQGEVLTSACKKGQSIKIEMIEGASAYDEKLRDAIRERGMDDSAEEARILHMRLKRRPTAKSPSTVDSATAEVRREVSCA